MTRIIFFGSSKHSLLVLKALQKSPKSKIAAVVTQPDRPKGRKQIPTPTPVKTFALKHGLAVLTPKNLSYKIAINKINNLKADLIVSAYFGSLIPQAILVNAKYGGLNLHPSLLPNYRGPSPAQWAILRGDKTSGITIIKMTEKIDAGKIVSSQKISITLKETSQSFYKKAFNTGARLLIQILPLYLSGNLNLKDQKSGRFVYARGLTRKDGKIDWRQNDIKIERMIRAFYPWPGVWTTLRELAAGYIKTRKQENKKTRDRRVKILKAHLDENKKLVIDEVQVAGKKSVSWKEFERGYLIYLPPPSPFSLNI